MIGIFLDIESNGLDVMRHRPLEIAFKFIDLLSQKELTAYSTIVSQSPETWDKSDPNSLKINGFTFDMLRHGKPESKVVQEILELFKTYKIQRGSAVYICQNPSFDRSFFSQLIPSATQEANHWPYHWLDLASMFWALTMKKFQSGESKPPWDLGISKNNIARTLQLPKEALPHKAMQGVEHLIDCYFALNTYP